MTTSSFVNDTLSEEQRQELQNLMNEFIEKVEMYQERIEHIHDHFHRLERLINEVV